jgi:hypothetical protein
MRLWTPARILSRRPRDWCLRAAVSALFADDPAVSAERAVHYPPAWISLSLLAAGGSRAGLRGPAGRLRAREAMPASCEALCRRGDAWQACSGRPPLRMRLARAPRPRSCSPLASAPCRDDSAALWTGRWPSQAVWLRAARRRPVRDVLVLDVAVRARRGSQPGSRSRLNRLSALAVARPAIRGVVRGVLCAGSALAAFPGTRTAVISRGPPRLAARRPSRGGALAASAVLCSAHALSRPSARAGRSGTLTCARSSLRSSCPARRLRPGAQPSPRAPRRRSSESASAALLFSDIVPRAAPIRRPGV